MSFTPAEGGVTVTLELRYTLKEQRPGMALVDLLFIRRPQRESLRAHAAALPHRGGS